MLRNTHYISIFGLDSAFALPKAFYELMTETLLQAQSVKQLSRDATSHPEPPFPSGFDESGAVVFRVIEPPHHVVVQDEIDPIVGEYKLPATQACLLYGPRHTHMVSAIINMHPRLHISKQQNIRSHTTIATQVTLQ